MKWRAVAEYADGTYIEKFFPYEGNGSWKDDNDRQFELEAWLIEGAHTDSVPVWYSVDIDY